MSQDDRKFASPTCYANEPGLGANGYVMFAPETQGWDTGPKGSTMRTDNLGEILLRDLPAADGPGLEGMLAIMRDATAEFDERKRLLTELKALRGD